MVGKTLFHYRILEELDPYSGFQTIDFGWMELLRLAMVIALTMGCLSSTVSAQGIDERMTEIHDALEDDGWFVVKGPYDEFSYAGTTRIGEKMFDHGWWFTPYRGAKVYRVEILSDCHNCKYSLIKWQEEGRDFSDELQVESQKATLEEGLRRMQIDITILKESHFRLEVQMVPKDQSTFVSKSPFNYRAVVASRDCNTLFDDDCFDKQSN